MQYRVEILNHFAPPRASGGVLLCPHEKADGLVQASRVYEIELAGDDGTKSSAIARFVEKVLVDQVSESYTINQPPMVSDFAFYLERSLKKSLLNLEREAILDVVQGMTDLGFDLQHLAIKERFYVLGDPEALCAEPFVQDMVNPVIHEWRVEHDCRVA